MYQKITLTVHGIWDECKKRFPQLTLPSSFIECTACVNAGEIYYDYSPKKTGSHDSSLRHESVQHVSTKNI